MNFEVIRRTSLISPKKVIIQLVKASNEEWFVETFTNKNGWVYSKPMDDPQTAMELYEQKKRKIERIGNNGVGN